MKVKEDYQFKGQITMFDILNLDSWSGRTSQELSVQETPKEQTSKQSSKKSVKSLSRKSPIFLYLKRDGLTQGASKEWVTMEHPSLLPGDCTMLNTGEFPNEERESHLSQILEVTPPPPILFEFESVSRNFESCEQEGQAASRSVGESTNESSSYTVKVRGGVEVDSLGHKAGKGALVQEELSGTLGVSQDQTLFQKVEDWVSAVNSSAKHQQDLIQSDLGVARTLAPGTHASGSHLTKTLITSNVLQDKKEPILLESNQNHATIQTNGISTSLPAAMGEGGGYVPMVVDEPKTYQDKTGSLLASGYNKLGTQEAANDMFVVQKPCNWDGSQIAPTLTANNADGSQRMPDKENFNAVIGFDSYNLAETGDKGRCLATASGGLNEHVPCVYSVDEGAGKSSACHYENVSPTLATTHHGEPAVCYGLDRASFNQGQNAKFDFSVEEDKAPTLVAKGPGGVMTSSEAWLQEITKE